MTDTKLEDKSEEKGSVARREKQAANTNYLPRRWKNRVHVHALRVADVLTHGEKINFKCHVSF